MTRPGRKPTTRRATADARQIAIRLSAEEYAQVEAAAGGVPVSSWARGVLLGATMPQMVSVDGGEPFMLPPDGIVRGGAR